MRKFDLSELDMGLKEILGDKNPDEVELFPETEPPFEVGPATASPPEFMDEDYESLLADISKLVEAFQTRVEELNEPIETTTQLLGNSSQVEDDPGG